MNTVTDASGRQLPVLAVAPPRIGDGRVSLIVGTLVLLSGLFALEAAAGGSDTAAFGQVALALSFFLLAMGLAKRLFHMIERRLIDVEKLLQKGT